jgi:biopolymer transport protein ExbD
MSRRRRRRKGLSNVELNLAAMLDMAFQLLAFFILTFRPSPIEGHLQVHMPPPVPVTNVSSEAVSSAPGDSGNTVPGLETLHITVAADDRGDVSEIKVGMRPVVRSHLHAVSLRILNEHLKSLFDIQSIPFDRIQLRVDGRLRYEELMKIVDVCTQQILPDGKPLNRVSFVELGQSEGL